MLIEKEEVSLQIVQHMSPGGIETLVLDLANNPRRGEKIIVLSLEGDKQNAEASWDRLKHINCEIHYLSKKSGIDIACISKITQICRKYNVKSVHTHHIGPLLYGGLGARFAGVKNIIHTEHDAWHLENKKRQRLQKALMKIVRPTVVADANYVAKQLEDILGLKNASVIKNGVDLIKFYPGDRNSCRCDLGLPLDKKIVGCAGRLESVKGHKNIIEALGLLDENVCLAIAGKGSEEENLRKLVKDQGLEERVFFLGHIDNVADFYRALDVFCLPSYREGYPLSSLEAQACGVRALVTDVGASSETVCPKTGMCVAESRPDILAKGIKLILGSKKLANPRNYVLNVGSAKTMIDNYAILRS